MKIFLRIFLLFILQHTCFSQESAGHIAITVGASVPIGDYASKDVYSEPAGFAKIGYKYDVGIAYKPESFFIGLSALIRGQSNALDVNAIADGFSKRFPGSTYTVNSAPWKVNSFMIGTYSPFKIGSTGKTSIYLKFMLGASACTMPQITMIQQLNGVSTTIKGAGATAVSAAYLFGGGIKYNMNEIICLLIDFDYLGTKPEFKSTNTQSITTLNFSAGIGFRL